MVSSFALGAFVATKTLQLGLKYHMQMDKGIAPELKPLRDIIDDSSVRHEAKKTNNLTSEMLSDILGGE